MSKRRLLSVVIWKQIIYHAFFFGSHGPVSSSTVARWLKVCLKNAGVDTSKFQAHSVRAAATSKVGLSGLTVENILKAAD